MFYAIKPYFEPNPEGANGGGSEPIEPTDPAPPKNDPPTLDVNQIKGKLSKDEREALRKAFFGEFSKNMQIPEDKVLIFKKDYEMREKAFQEAEKLREEKLKEQGKYKELLESTEKEMEEKEAKYRQEIEEANKQLKKEQELRINEALKREVISKLISSGAHDPSDVYKILEGSFRFQDNLPTKPIEIIDTDGEPVYDKESRSKKLTLDQFIDQIRSSKPHLFDMKKVKTPDLGNGIGPKQYNPDLVKSASEEEFKEIEKSFFK